MVQSSPLFIFKGAPNDANKTNLKKLRSLLFLDVVNQKGGQISEAWIYEQKKMKALFLWNVVIFTYAGMCNVSQAVLIYR